MTNGHRIPQDAGDTVRDLQRRLIAQERRPGVPNVRQYIGNGIGPQARHIIDWNDVNIFQNGWYYSDELSINGPDQESAWIGQVIVAKGGHGIMEVWQHSGSLTAEPMRFTRSFHYHQPPELPEFSAWAQVGVDIRPDTDWIYVGSGGSASNFVGTWTNFGPGHTPARYRRRSGITYVQGLVTGGGTGTQIFGMPVGFRPEASPGETDPKLVMSGMTDAGEGRIDVFPSGGIVHINGGTSFVSLSKLIFPADQ
jgi:hypothetical protein